MPSHLVILPVLIPLIAGVVNVFLKEPRSLQRRVVMVALLLNLACSLGLLWTVLGGTQPSILVSQMGNWPAPFGITVVVDGTSALLLATSAVVAVGAFWFGLSQLPPRFTGGYFYTLIPMLIVSVNWAFIAGDVFNLFVSFEILLLVSYTLLTSGTTPRQMRHAYKYVVLNLVVSAVFVAACGWVYGTTGTLNFAELAVLAETGQIDRPATMAIAGLAFVFATKAAAFPLWFWLPEVYPTLPPTLGAFFGGLLTKVGIYALLRLLCMSMGGSDLVLSNLTPLLLVSAGGTMLLAVLGAVGSRYIRRILSLQLVSHVGYMILGVGLCTAALQLPAGEERTRLATVAIAATLIYTLQHMVVKCTLFLCGGLIEKYAGTDDLRGMGGLLKRDVTLGVLFFIAAMSLVGLPPLSGFFGKLMLVQSSFELGGAAGVTLAIIALLTGFLTLVAMGRVWAMSFWSPAPAASKCASLPLDWRPPRRNRAMWPIAVLVLVALSMGLGAHWYYGLATEAAHDVVNPDRYIRAVLGERAADYARTGDESLLLREVESAPGDHHEPEAGH